MNSKTGFYKIRSDGRGELRVCIDGVKKSFYGSTEAETRRKYRDYIKNLEKNNKKYSNMTVSEYIQNWLNTFKFGIIKDSSYDRMESIFTVHIKDSGIGKMKMKDVRSEDIQDFLNDKSETLSYSSVKKMYELFNPSFKHAFNQEDIGKNPMPCVVMPKQNTMNIKTKKVDMYSECEVGKIMDACMYDVYKNNQRRYRYIPIFLFIINTGIRIGECVSLEWSDIDFTNKLLYINKTTSFIKNRDRYQKKTKKVSVITTTKTENGERVIPLNETALNALREIKIRNDEQKINSNYILCNYQGEPLKVRSVEQTFERICKEINVQYKGIHALRHTFGSMLIRRGIDVKVVSELLGHSNVTLTYNKYIHIIKEQKAKAINMLDFTKDLNGWSNGGQDKVAI